MTDPTVSDAWTRLQAEALSFYSGIRDVPVVPDASPEAIRAQIEREFTFEAPIPLDELTGRVAEMLRRWTVHITHPRYFGLFNPSVRQAGVIADALAAAFNPQLAAWSHAPAANEIERTTLRRLMPPLGMDPATCAAHFTSGGAEANLTAVLAALSHHFPDSGASGVAGLPRRPMIYLTSESHHSFVKIARMTGLGTDALRQVPIDSRLRLDPAALAAMIEADRAAGRHPLMIIGTAGTTGGGIIDPLRELADIAEDCGAWFHVDGAWGAASVLSPSLRPALAGIERADSVTWDAHKWLSVPMGAGMIFCRHPAAFHRAFGIATSYMPGQAGEEMPDPYATTAQWSRRVIGLKVFMSLAEIGLEGYRELIDQQTRMGDLLRARLEEGGWRVVNDTPLPLVCFTHPRIEEGDRTTREVLDVVYRRRKVWISEVVLGGQPVVLRACITSFRTEESDIDCLLEELENALAEGR